MEFLTRTLRRHERGDYARHLISLDAEDRRLRFGLARNDDSIREYVNGIDVSRDAILGITDDELDLVGAAHLAYGEGFVEVGVSVLRGHRGRGVGSALLARARLHARTRGVSELFTHCAADNTAMMQLARKHGMRAVVEAGDADAFLPVPAPDPAAFAAELLAERMGALDHAVKTQMLSARRLASAFRRFTLTA